MKTFIYKYTDHSHVRGFNTTITVYELQGHNCPLWVGDNDRIHSDDTPGILAEACLIIHKERGHKLCNTSGIAASIEGGSSMLSKNINVYQV